MLLTISIGRRPIPQCCTEKDKRFKNPAPFYLYCPKKPGNSDMKRLFSGLLLALTLIANAQQPTDSLLHALTQAIGKAPDYDSAKTKRIDALRRSLPPANSHDQQALFDGYERLYDEYRIFIYDSAYQYAGKLQEIAYRLGDAHLITRARLRLCFILLSSGLFRETYDSLRATDIRQEPDSLKAIYYTLLGRYYYDLANYDYDGNEHSIDY